MFANSTNKLCLLYIRIQNIPMKKNTVANDQFQATFNNFYCLLDKYLRKLAKEVKWYYDNKV